LKKTTFPTPQDAEAAFYEALERADLEWADLVARVGCGDACPVIAGRRYLDWNVQDPNQTDPETTRRIRDEIANHVEALLYELDGADGE